MGGLTTRLVPRLSAALVAAFGVMGCVNHRPPPMLAADLQSPDPATRSAVAHEMARGPVHGSVAPFALLALRREPSAETFATLLVGLARSGIPCAVPAVVANLENDDKVVREAAKKAQKILLSEFGDAVRAASSGADPRDLLCSADEDIAHPARYSAPAGPSAAAPQKSPAAPELPVAPPPFQVMSIVGNRKVRF